jgi:hypothetical protein
MYDPDEHRTIAKLLGLFGEKECLRLSFLAKDDNARLLLTTIGTGYLVDVEAREVNTLHEAYAAGYSQEYDQAKDGF